MMHKFLICDCVTEFKHQYLYVLSNVSGGEQESAGRVAVERKNNARLVPAFNQHPRGHLRGVLFYAFCCILSSVGTMTPLVES